MESRLAPSVRANIRLFSCVSPHQSLRRGIAMPATPTGRHADPAIHSEEPNESDIEVPTGAAEAGKQTEDMTRLKESDPFATPKPPYAASPQLESNPVNQPSNPNLQQKRHQSTAGAKAVLDGVNCAGIDGSPWPDDKEESRRQRREQEEDDKEYFSHHKASPLSEIEVADTRRPITKATDGTADSYLAGSGDVILWREEQLDSAEDSLLRAMKMWRERAMRGDPDSPHGKVLRELRGEFW
ncbi:hypothetical protein NMG60_11035074 [Bertholletia excelsa]